jgi:hypothetical protein
MKVYGFYARAYGKDCFYKTDRKNKTTAAALDFINSIQNKLNRFSNIDADTVERFKYSMRPAVLEVRETASGKKYIDISGVDFGGYGPDGLYNSAADALAAMVYIEK